VDDSCAGIHLLSWNRHSLATKKVTKVGKVKKFGSIIPYGLFQTKGEICAKFGSDWFINVNLYKVQTHTQTNKQTFSFIYNTTILKVNHNITLLSYNNTHL